ncbi:hypothetical protein [Streptomyces sp. NPDC056361]|uniref:hypothetical protein n=1 Tax=Streptomyces sp. NPDC056361 TaxID=3345795 RepID=UPI0035D5A49B
MAARGVRGGLLAGVNVLSARVAARYGAKVPIVVGRVVARTGLLVSAALATLASLRLPGRRG